MFRVICSVVWKKSYLKPKIRCCSKNVVVDYFTFRALHSAGKFSNEQQIFGLILNKPYGMLLIQKFVRKIKGSKRKTVNGQIFEWAANLVFFSGRSYTGVCIIDKPDNLWGKNNKGTSTLKVKIWKDCIVWKRLHEK